MLYQQTLDRLHAMKLIGMAEALDEQRRTPSLADMAFEERLGLLIERQWLWRQNRSFQSRLKNARLKQPACMEDIDYRSSRGLARDTIDQMQAAEWIAKGRYCLITGATGTGKSYLACALAQQACRDGYSSMYYHATKLFRELSVARIDGSLSKLLGKLMRPRLLVIDDLGLEKANEDDYRNLLEIIDDRHGTTATLITSQFPVNAWYELVGNPTIADALLDRILNAAYRITLTGDSMRKLRNPIATKGQPAATTKPSAASQSSAGNPSKSH